MIGTNKNNSGFKKLFLWNNIIVSRRPTFVCAFTLFTPHCLLAVSFDRRASPQREAGRAATLALGELVHHQPTWSMSRFDVKMTNESRHLNSLGLTSLLKTVGLFTSTTSPSAKVQNWSDQPENVGNWCEAERMKPAEFIHTPHKSSGMLLVNTTLEWWWNFIHLSKQDSTLC